GIMTDSATNPTVWVPFQHRSILPLAPGTGRGKIFGRVFKDLNQNGQVDSGDLPLAGTRVDLVDGSIFTNPLVDSMVTDQTGVFSFEVPTPHVYVLKQTPPAGLIPSNAHQGVGGTRLDAQSLVVRMTDDLPVYTNYVFLAKEPLPF